jgi:amidophosphoribosyltransferase
VKWPFFFGIDFASRAELIANGMSVDEIRRSIGADSLGYISLEGLIEATSVPGPKLCRACFDGVYPMEMPEAHLLGKHLLEGPVDAPLTLGPDGLEIALTGGGAVDALSRP